MKWGSFGPVHLVSLALATAMIVLLYFALRKASRKIQTLVLGVLSFSGIAAIIFNLVTWGSPLEYLPLHLCSINIFVIAIHAWKPTKLLGGFLYTVCIPGAIAALLFPTYGSARSVQATPWSPSMVKPPTGWRLKTHWIPP